MRAVWVILSMAAATAFVLAGCATVDPTKPPKMPETMAVPPIEDARYSSPPRYPKEMLNAERIPTSIAVGNNGPGARPQRPGGIGPAGGMQ